MKESCRCGNGNENDGCACGGTDGIGWTDSKKESFAFRAKRALYKAAEGVGRSTNSNSIFFSSEGREICAFIIKVIEPLESPKVKLKEELFIFLGIWDEPKAFRFNEKNLNRIDKVSGVNLIQILRVSLTEGVSFKSEVEGRMRAGIIVPPFDK